MGKEWDKLGGSFTTAKGRGEGAAQHGTGRKGFDDYGPLPNYIGGGNIKCPDCGDPVDGRNPAKPDRRRGCRCVCGGAKRERQRLASSAIQEWHTAWLTEVFRVLEPGGRLKTFGGTRVFHRLAAAMGDVGFTDIQLEAWAYGSGFPKSHNVAVYMDRMLTEGKSRTVIRKGVGNLNGKFAEAGKGFVSQSKAHTITTTEATPWIGWGTALKPAWEPVLTGVKP